MSRTKLEKRVITLVAVSTIGLCATLLIPESPPMKESRLAKHLPEVFDGWHGKRIQVSDRELEILAKDTSFERKIYSNWDSVSDPGVQVSIVFSGKDLNNSIHRPEICLRTQGWEFVSESYRAVEGGFSDGALPVKEIVCRRTRQNAEGKPVLGDDGEPIRDWQLLYYTFIGHERYAAGHYQRTFIDIRDRLLKGYDQTWAYATFAVTITGKYENQGVDLGLLKGRSTDETRSFLDEFIGDLFPYVSDTGL